MYRTYVLCTLFIAPRRRRRRRRHRHHHGRQNVSHSRREVRPPAGPALGPLPRGGVLRGHASRGRRLAISLLVAPVPDDAWCVKKYTVNHYDVWLLIVGVYDVDSLWGGRMMIF